MGLSKIDIVKHPSILEHHSLPKHHSLSQKVNPTGTAVLNTRQEFHRSLSPVTLRWAVFYTNVTSDNCPARFQYPLLPTNQYSIQYYPIVINAIHCYSILSTSSAPTEILWAFQTSPGELFKSSHTEPSPWLLYKLNNCSPKFSEREKNGVVANISI